MTPDPTLDFPFPTVHWRDGAVVMIDQTRLPEETVFLECRDIETLCRAIKALSVRGAPAIGVAAAGGMTLSWHLSLTAGKNREDALAALARDREILAATRPTAVNLFWALRRQMELAESLAAEDAGAEAIGEALAERTEAIRLEDIDLCRKMGRAGAELLPDEATIITHCNAGGLATGGYGTALGVAFAAQEMGKRIHVYADETRPLLQGARLTAWEMVQRGIEVTVMCEGAAASLLRSGRVDAVITGADRIVRNGDVANKIGTYPLAVLADRHDTPFYVAAPYSTFDAETATGEDIEIELRDEHEVLGYRDQRIAAAGAGAWNPAFDVTPNDLVSAIVTELGVLRAPYLESLAALGRG